MASYSYMVPELISYHTDIPIYNEQNEVIYLLKKNRHRILTLIAHSLLRFGMPFCYQIQTIEKASIYKIDCVFTGFGYTLQNCVTSEIIPIKHERQHVIDKIQTFLLNGDIFKLEKDVTCKGILTKNGVVIATIKELDKLKVCLSHRISVEAIDDQSAALAIVMYHTFIFWGA